MAQLNDPAPAHTVSSAESTCIYCGAEETTFSPLYHGPVYDDPYSEIPDVRDYAYCEDCSNRGGWNTKDPHRYFANCTRCDREFWEYSELYVLEDDNPDNPFEESACLRCVRTRRIELEIRCKMCGGVADGYYCNGFCRSCECGCIGIAVDRQTCRNSKAGQ